MQICEQPLHLSYIFLALIGPFSGQPYEPHPYPLCQSFLIVDKKKLSHPHSNQSQIMGYHGWNSILMITLLSRTKYNFTMDTIKTYFANFSIKVLKLHKGLHIVTLFLCSHTAAVFPLALPRILGQFG